MHIILILRFEVSIVDNDGDSGYYYCDNDDDNNDNCTNNNHINDDINVVVNKGCVLSSRS